MFTVYSIESIIWDSLFIVLMLQLRTDLVQAISSSENFNGMPGTRLPLLNFFMLWLYRVLMDRRIMK